MTVEEIVKQVNDKEAALQMIKDNVSKRVNNIASLVDGMEHSLSDEFKDLKVDIKNTLTDVEKMIHTLLHMK